MSRIVVITGGTAGVGRAVARRFAQAHDTVAVLARGPDGLAATVAEIDRLGGKGLGIPTDVADAAQVERAAERIEYELGPIDVWINNAMTTAVGPVHVVTPDELRRVTDVCYHGFVWGTRAALSYMRARGRGTIIQVGSALAYRSIPLQAAYCGAKHAIRGFTDSLRSELLHDGIAIDLCMVQLPAVNTPQFDWCVNKMPNALQPVPPIYQPEIVADAIYALSHRPRREVFLGWSSIEAIVGNRIAPGLADRVLATRGYRGQLLPEPNRNLPTNLYRPVAGDHGAHGRFDARARARSAVARIATVLGGTGVQAALVALGAAITVGLGLAVRRVVRA